jgi:thioredoxin 2
MIFRCASCGGINRVDPARAHPKCGRCGTALSTDGAPIQVNDDQLEALVRSSPVPVLVDFYADWCQPCKVLGPLLHQLGTAHAGRLIVAKVDTERDQRTASRLGVEGIPAVFVFRGGEVVDQAVGVRPYPAWEQLVAPHLG